MTNKNNKPLTTYILWAVFIGLLLVLLPHTAWAFSKFEPSGDKAFAMFSTENFTITSSTIISYIGAFAFEAAIAALVHKLAQYLEKKVPAYVKTGNYQWLKKFAYQYINPISIALFITTSASALANLAHAVEFGQPLKIFDEWGVPFSVYAVAFGGILPFVSLTFARVLSNVADDEEAANPELLKANEDLRELRRQLRDAELKAKVAEEKSRRAEENFAAIGDLVKYLFGEDKRQRIVAARKQWLDLPNKAIAIITGTSEAYVSEVLRENVTLEA